MSHLQTHEIAGWLKYRKDPSDTRKLPNMSTEITDEQGRQQGMDSTNANKEMRLPVPKTVEGDNQPVEIESLMLDMFFNILQNLHGPGIKATVREWCNPQYWNTISLRGWHVRCHSVLWTSIASLCEAGDARQCFIESLMVRCSNFEK